MAIGLLLRISVLLFVGLLYHELAAGADIRIKQSGNRNDSLDISLTGEIKRGDEIVFARLARGARKLSVHLDSAGGDVDAAISIGRIVRSGEGTVYAAHCYSACVLIFAGGEMRFGWDLFTEPVVGVHRIFFAALQPGLTASQVKTRYDAQLARVRSYLAEMNVAPEIVSFMQSFGPSEMHILTRQELKSFGLDWDVISNERLVAEKAANLGISSMEYRTRAQRGREQCKDDDAKVKENILFTGECSFAIYFGIPVELYRARLSQVLERCRRFDGDTNKKNLCQEHFIATGSEAP